MSTSSSLDEENAWIVFQINICQISRTQKKKSTIETLQMNFSSSSFLHWSKGHFLLHHRCDFFNNGIRIEKKNNNSSSVCIETHRTKEKEKERERRKNRQETLVWLLHFSALLYKKNKKSSHLISFVCSLLQHTEHLSNVATQFSFPLSRFFIVKLNKTRSSSWLRISN